jgi:uncharacterized protein (TIGR02421 family)
MGLDSATTTTDRCLAAVADRLDYLLAVTPIDTEGVWRAFEASGFTQLPTLHYRELGFDPDEERRALAALPVDDIVHPATAAVLGGLRDELLTTIAMVEARDTDAFIEHSAVIHGLVGEEELAAAGSVLDILHGWSTDWRDADPVDASGFADAGRAEIARLRERHGELDAGVEVRDDVHGVMVVRRQLLVDSRHEMDPRRVEALVQHEVGTHIVTEVNGAAQPLRCLGTGLAGYESTQEGVAVLAEHAAGGLTGERMALLAARTLVVRRRCEEQPFADTVDELTDGHGFPRRGAFDVVLRVHRGGGLLKDAGYLRGLDRALGHVASGADLEPLLVGKVSFEALDDVMALLDDGILTPAQLWPSWVEDLEPDALPGHVVALATALREDAATAR